MGRAKLAYVDMAVPRQQLTSRLARRRIRIQLWEAMRRLGAIDESTIKFARDPLDGELVEHGTVPTDQLAIVRMAAMVAPRD